MAPPLLANWYGFHLSLGQVAEKGPLARPRTLSMACFIRLRHRDTDPVKRRARFAVRLRPPRKVVTLLPAKITSMSFGPGCACERRDRHLRDPAYGTGQGFACQISAAY